MLAQHGRRQLELPEDAKTYLVYGDGMPICVGTPRSIPDGVLVPRDQGLVERMLEDDERIVPRCSSGCIGRCI